MTLIRHEKHNEHLEIERHAMFLVSMDHLVKHVNTLEIVEGRVRLRCLEIFFSFSGYVLVVLANFPDFEGSIRECDTSFFRMSPTAMQPCLRLRTVTIMLLFLFL